MVLAVDESSVAGLSVFAVESLIFGLVGTRVSALPNPGDIVADACMCLCCANVYMRSVGVVFGSSCARLGERGGADKGHCRFNIHKAIPHSNI